ncbi:MAG: DUF4358 domain-containing protein, partial [Lachnospiraceae bacterium]|nr:DUF4358 domain-containing protein [Lachnospiraceae bacterium]
ILIVMGMLVLAFAGCKKEIVEEYKGPNIDVKQTYEEMKSAVELSQIDEESSQDDEDGSTFEMLFDGFDYSNVKEYYYCSAADGKPDEIAIIKVKDDKVAQDLKKAVQKHKETKVDAFSTYEPKYVEIVENGLVVAKDNYVMYAVGKFAPRIKAKFDNAFE